MPLISEMPRGRAVVETFPDPSSLLHAKRSEGVSVRSEQDKDQEEEHRHRGYDEQANFEEFDQDECSDSDMEGSILHRPRPKKVVKAPALPQRNEKRVSRLLDNVMLELQKIDGSARKEEDVSRLDQEDPHQLYLSSEEDASLSDDYDDTDSLQDFEEIYSEDENGGSTSRASSRRSQEITARCVSLMVVKPQIVEIHIPISHTAPVTPAEEKEDLLDDALPTITTKAPSPTQSRQIMRRPPPLNLANARPMSMATTGSYASSATTSSYISSYYPPSMTSNASMINLPTTNIHPIRKSSRLASLVTSTKASLSNRSSSFSASTSASSTHSFLNSDPFAQSANLPNPPLTPIHLSAPTTPKTPTSSAWKKSISRTLSKATRKPSLQTMNTAYNNSLSSSNMQRTSTMSSITLSVLSRIPSNAEPTNSDVYSVNYNALQDTERREGTSEEPVRRAETMPLTPSPREAPMGYQDLMRGRVPPPIPDNASQQLPREGRKSFSLGMGIGLGRKKSLKRT
ncbi:hypothetical protein VTL71DRAFT_5686 [Oculimacula yallundae]|uniref:Uncharacterized protein n=1 Tax=Oculimacula yallundae TaxID=86028 RepID=A0ABR4BZW4_9HELO